ncbi:unnamed protein product, partial [Gongylonema pulchrum]|uniref:Aminotran_5 domain-containing protein n=1 Tax=Gongylonema pulchrum TaxID=637853 RepID=A0A183CX51_9BILA
GESCIRNDDIISTIEEQGDSIAVIWFSGVHYYNGQLFDIKRITKAGHDKGCLVGWELAHGFANVPLSLHAWDVDFACWCTYKYGCSGAGGIGGFFVHKRFENDKRERMLGWWAHKMDTRFDMDNKMDLDCGAAGFRISNPPMMLVVPIVGFLQVFSKTTIQDLRSKSVLLTGYLEYLINHFLSPSSLNRRTKRVDKRYPDVIRVTPVHLYNSFTDVHRFMRALLDSLNIVEIDLEKH